jgi:succinate-semialdehyde dehydrogenase / glutarate-semialdehyde dehydrogenase
MSAGSATPAYPQPALFIDGSWTEGTSGAHDVVLDPATGEGIGTVPHASTEDVDRAVAAAARGAVVWRETPIEARTAILREAARLVRERAGDIGLTMTREQGKPLAESRGEAVRVAKALEWDAEDARRAYGRIIPSDSDTVLTVRHDPVGPVAGFTPWNFPAGSPMRKIAGPLSAGCSVVLKASEETPATACALVQAFADAGLPPGVLNLVFGVPAQISAQLIGSPSIRMIAFTGSIPVGKQLAAAAGAAMKPAVMELGGHAPVIVCEDADPVQAARTAVTAKFANAGQVCTSPSRFFVHESLLEDFTSAFLDETSKITVGNGLEPGVRMGPLANPRRVAAMERLVADAVEKGAKVRLGGERPNRPGFFFEPTVLSDVPADAAVMSEEPFGPIAPITGFTDLGAAVEAANALPFGLAAYGYTRDAGTAELLARRLEAGILSINHCGGSVPEAPSGGVKESGYGREGGLEGVEAYLVTKRVSHKVRP